MEASQNVRKLEIRKKIEHDSLAKNAWFSAKTIARR